MSLRDNTDLPTVPLLFAQAIMPGLLRTTFPKSITTRLDDGRKLPEVGRVMWAKEAFRCHYDPSDYSSLIVTYSDGIQRTIDLDNLPMKWDRPRASIHGGLVSPLLMPRFMTRYSAPLTAVRREPLWDITEEQACREGLPFCYDDRELSGDMYWLCAAKVWHYSALDAFMDWWDHLHPEKPWDSNPMVKRFEWDPLTAEVYRG